MVVVQRSVVDVVQRVMVQRRFVVVQRGLVQRMEWVQRNEAVVMLPLLLIPKQE